MQIKRLLILTVGCGAFLGPPGCGGGESSPPPPNLSISTASLADGTVTFPYSQTIQATGGEAPFAWSASSGNLPHSVVLGNSSSSSVAVYGTPDTVETASFTIQIKDSAGKTASKSYTFNIRNTGSVQLRPVSGQVPVGIVEIQGLGPPGAHRELAHQKRCALPTACAILREPRGCPGAI
jgi:Putative Ig domain